MFSIKERKTKQNALCGLQQQQHQHHQQQQQQTYKIQKTFFFAPISLSAVFVPFDRSIDSLVLLLFCVVLNCNGAVHVLVLASRVPDSNILFIVKYFFFLNFLRDFKCCLKKMVENYCRHSNSFQQN